MKISKYRVLLGFFIGLSMLIVGCINIGIRLNFIVDNVVYHSITTVGNTIIEMPEEPQKDDYVFDGWYFDKDVWDDPFTADTLLNTPLVKTTSVYCKWLSKDVLLSDYVVSFDSMGGTLIDNVNVRHGNLVSEPTAPTKNNYIFSGWYKGADYSSKWDFNIDTVKEELTLYAKWVANNLYNATFETNGGTTIASYKIDIIETSPVTKKDYNTFIDWYLDSNFNKLTKVSFPYELTEDTTFYARWMVESSAEGLHFTLQSESNSYFVTRYIGEATDIVIPSMYNDVQVTGISYRAFEGCNLSSIFIPDSVTSIASEAFVGCNLSSITIPNSVTSIGNSAFSDCTNLTYNKLNGINYLGNDDNPYLFLANVDDTTLNSYQIHNSTKIIRSHAFFYCNSLTSINVDSNNQYYSSIDGVLFNKNQTILIYYPNEKTGDYTIPSSVTSIKDYAFRDCGHLTSITLPSSITYIGDNAFYGCINLTYNKSNGFNYLGNDDNPYLFLASVDDKTLNSYQIHNSTKIIGYSAFYGYKLTSIFIPSSVTSIGSYAFSGCNLTSITIPDSVTSIGDYAFRNCSKLTTINVDGNNQYYSSINGVLFNKNQTILICYPAAKNGKYIMPSSVASIASYAFYGCSKLIQIGFDNDSHLDSIGFGAFYGCNSLTTITIPSSVTSIKGFAFYGCSKLTSITIPSSVTSVVFLAFDSWTSAQTIYVKGYSSTPAGWNYSWNYNCSANIVWNA